METILLSYFSIYFAMQPPALNPIQRGSIRLIWCKRSINGEATTWVIEQNVEQIVNYSRSNLGDRTVTLCFFEIGASRRFLRMGEV